MPLSAASTTELTATASATLPPPAPSPESRRSNNHLEVSVSKSVSQVVFHLEDDPTAPAASHLLRPRSGSNPPTSYHHNDPQPHRGQIALSPPLLSVPMPQAVVDKRDNASEEPEGGKKNELPEATRAAYKEAKNIADLENGLPADVIEAQRARYGWNESIEKQTPLWLLFLQKFHGPVPYMIMIAIVVAFALQKWVDGIVIAILLLINGLLAFHEDLRARKAMQELVKSLQAVARVKRNGEWSELAARELVPGDMIRLRTGDLAGADVCILNGQLSVDQSALTGESDLKNIGRDGLLFAGSIIKRGEANALVVATGSSTYFGKTAQLVQASAPNAHIQRIVTRIVGLLMSLILILVVVTLIVLGVRGDSISDAIPLLLMVIITALPVALPAMFTVSMALGSKELSRRSVLVTRLNVIEDCALMNILFSDKTGTLSQNLMSVQSIVPLLAGSTPRDVLLAAALCSLRENADPIDHAVLNAVDYHKAAGSISKANDSSDNSQANVVNGQEMLDVSMLLPNDDILQYKTLKFDPFDAAKRRTEALVRPKSDSNSDSASVVRVTKGAVATLALAAGISLTSDAYKKIDALVEANAKRGYKSLAVGIGALDDEEANRDHEADEKEAMLASDPHEHHSHPVVPSSSPQFRLLGLISLHDPPRTDSAAVIAKLRSLGIATKMLTGDSIGVAIEMGRQLHLGTEFVNLEREKQKLRESWADAIKEGEQTPVNMLPTGSGDVRVTIAKKAETPAEMEKRMIIELLTRFDPMKITGFAQIFPADKHAIVQYAQSKHFVCGMTGDGVNDAPALKQAEVGCAVSNATDVAKGSASALLLKDGLSGVPDMVEVGRQVHNRVVVWVVNKVAKAAMHSVFILVLFLILGRFPITALQVVLLLLLMDFVLISIATDVQAAGHAPATWNLAQLTRVGMSLGLPGAGQILALILVMEHMYDQSVDESQTTAWLAMFTWGMLAVFAAREKRFFWKSTPSRIMLWLLVAEQIGVWLVCSLGASSEVVAIGFAKSSAVVGIGLGCFVLNDAIKVMWITMFDKSYNDLDLPQVEPVAEERVDEAAVKVAPVIVSV